MLDGVQSANTATAGFLVEIFHHCCPWHLLDTTVPYMAYVTCTVPRVMNLWMLC